MDRIRVSRLYFTVFSAKSYQGKGGFGEQRGELMKQQSGKQQFIYRIDQNDTIFYVNDQWLLFARENDVDKLTFDAVINQSLWSFITNVEVQHLYGLFLARVRATRLPIKLPFRCDAPDCRRYMELSLYPLSKKGVEFRSRILKLETRDPVGLLDASLERSNQLIRMCSWCKKVYTDQCGWVEVEKATRVLKLFDAPKMPQITHGMCPVCFENCLQELAA